MQTIQDYILANRTMANPRFSFVINDSVESDLLQCYKHVVEMFGCVFNPCSETLNIIKSAAKWLKSGKRGLLLTGKCGTGKTRLMQAISLYINYKHNRQKLHIFSADKICRLALSKNEDELQLFSNIATYEYLGIDDLGTEPQIVKNYGTDLSPIVDILYNRYNEQLITVLSTNDSLETLSKKYGERISDRFSEMYDRIIFNFKSFRQ